MAEDIQATLAALLPMLQEKPGDAFLREHAPRPNGFGKTQHYVTKGLGIKPIRPEYFAAVLSELAEDDDPLFADTGPPASVPPATSPAGRGGKNGYTVTAIKPPAKPEATRAER